MSFTAVNTAKLLSRSSNRLSRLNSRVCIRYQHSTSNNNNNNNNNVFNQFKQQQSTTPQLNFYSNNATATLTHTQLNERTQPQYNDSDVVIENQKKSPEQFDQQTQDSRLKRPSWLPNQMTLHIRTDPSTGKEYVVIRPNITDRQFNTFYAICVVWSFAVAWYYIHNAETVVYADDTLPKSTPQFDTSEPNSTFITLNENNDAEENKSIFGRIWSKVYSYLPGFLTSDNDVSPLPPAQPDMYGRQPRTLVIGWDTVLVATEWTRQHGWRMQARNDAAYFLRKAFESGYEIVLWCNQPQHDIEQHTMSPYIGGDIIRHRLYYDNMSMKQFKTVKDLSKLNRDLKRVIVIDTSNKLYWLQPDNCIVIPQFQGNPADRELSNLIPILEKIQKYNVHDVRTLIHQYNQDKNTNLFAIHEQLAQNAKQSLGTYKSDDTSSEKKLLQNSGVLAKLTSLFSSKPQLTQQKLKLDFNDDD